MTSPVPRAMTKDGISEEIFLVTSSRIVTRTTTAKAARNHGLEPAGTHHEQDSDEAGEHGRHPNPVDLLTKQSSGGEGDRKRDELQHRRHVREGEVAEREQKEAGADRFETDAGPDATVTQHPEPLMVTIRSRHQRDEHHEYQATNEDRLEQLEVLDRLLHEGVVHHIAEHAERHPCRAAKVLLVAHFGSVATSGRGGGEQRGAASPARYARTVIS